MKITYIVTVADEPEFHKLYENLRINKRDEDNIFVLADLNKLNNNQSLKDEIYKLSSQNKINLIEDYFTGNFAEWKNKILGRTHLNDWLIFLDSDERLPPQLIDDLPLILELNPDVDIIGLPRINIVKNIGLSDVEKWGWNVGKLEQFQQEKEFDLNNPDDLDQYNLLVNYDLIIEEKR